MYTLYEVPPAFKKIHAKGIGFLIYVILELLHVEKEI